MKKIVLIGPESTGKTTMCEKLSKHFSEPCVPEFAREYLTHLDRPYEKDDLLEIARGQIRGEESKTKEASELIFCDTDLLVIKVWSDHIYGTCDEWIEKQIKSRRYDHYFLCRNDFPWKADPLRENPELGDYFFNVFRNLLIDGKKSFTILEGSEQSRFEMAVKAISNLP